VTRPRSRGRLFFVFALVAASGSLAATDAGHASHSIARLSDDDDPPPRDAGRSTPPALSSEDQEVVRNLELLQNLDGLKDLDLLIELSKEK
jgi:hypothetical protein